MNGDFVRAPRIMVAATASGMGKTIITCGLLRALQRRGLSIQACKCGPDYLDPAFHERVLGIPSRNLDLFLGSTELVRALVAQGAHGRDLTVMEGVMGYYDGLGATAQASSYDVAHTTETPVLLVVDGRGRALSCAAEVAGFVHFRTPSHVAGILLNRVSTGYYPVLKEAIEAETGVPVVGYVPLLEAASLASRHLGLVAAGEVSGLQEQVDRVADTLAQTVDIDAILALAQRASVIRTEPLSLPTPCTGSPCIAVARDDAFSFYYYDTLALFEQLGARITTFSPLNDHYLPADACGLFLGGGYPELHARQLSANEELRLQIRAAIDAGMPTIAECGGFLYLHQTLEDAEGIAWPQVGVVPGHALRRNRLGRFGYVHLTARRDSLLACKGEQLRAHEFHYWSSDCAGDAFCAHKASGTQTWDTVVATASLHAGFPHMYLAAQPQAAMRFVEACAVYGRAKGGRAS